MMCFFSLFVMKQDKSAKNIMEKHHVIKVICHLVHCPHKTSGEYGEDETRDELEQDAVQPEGEGEVEAALQAPVVDLKVVESEATLSKSVVRDLHAR